MGMSIRITGASFNNPIASLTLPFRDGLVGEYLFGGTEVASIRNLANPAKPLTKVGSPVFGGGYVRVSSGPTDGSHGFDTGMAPPLDDISIITVVRKVAGKGFPPFISTVDPYTGFHNYTNVPALYNSQSGTMANVADIPVPAHTNFAFIAGLLPKGLKGRIEVFDGGVKSTNTAEVNGGPSRPALLWRIGTSLANSGEGQADIAYIATFDRLLTSAEVDDAYASLKAYLGTRGVTVS